jgi:signal transduction histidine kinase
LLEDEADEIRRFRAAINAHNETSAGGISWKLFATSKTAIAEEYLFFSGPRSKIDVFFIDLQLGSSLAGLQFLERNGRKLSDTAIVVYSQTDDPKVSERCTRAGAHYYIQKPPNITERYIENAIIYAISNARRQREKELAENLDRFLGTISSFAHESLREVRRIQDLLSLLHQTGLNAVSSANVADVAKCMEICGDFIDTIERCYKNSSPMETSEVKWQRIAPVELVDKIVKQYKNYWCRRYGRQGISIRVDGPAELICLLDTERMSEVFVNILDNSSKFTRSEHVEVEISADIVELEDGKQYVRFVCRDRGIGVSEEELVKITEPFYKTNQSRQSLGWGFGLTCALQQVELHSIGAARASLKAIRPDDGVGLAIEITIPQPML